MGGTCSCENEESNKNDVTDRLRPERKYRNKTMGSPTDDAMTADDNSEAFTPTPSMDTLAMEGSPSFMSPSPTPSNEHSVAISGFKKAVRSGDVDKVQHFVQTYLELDLFEIPFSNGDTALHIATKLDNYDLVAYLLANGMAANEQNPKNGDSPLIIATRRRNTKIVSVLTGYMYDGDAILENHNGESALSISLQNGDLEIYQHLSPDTNTDDHLHFNSETHDMTLSKPTPVYSQSGAVKNTPTEIDLDGFDQEDEDRDDHKSNEFEDEEEEEEEGIEDSALSPDSEELKATLQTFYGEKSTLQEILAAEQILREKCKSINRSSMTQVQELATSSLEIQKVEGWLQKKKNSGVGSYQRRYAIIKGAHLFWSEQLLTETVLNSNAVPKINNSIYMLHITELVPVREGKTQRKFRFFVGSRNKEYLWKTENEQERDQWVRAMQKHMAQMRGVVTYLKTH